MFAESCQKTEIATWEKMPFLDVRRVASTEFTSGPLSFRGRSDQTAPAVRAA